MPFAATCSLLLALASAPPGAGEDISAIDRPERSRGAADAERFEARAARRSADAPELELARGDTVFIEIEVPLSRAPKSPVEGRAIDGRTSRDVALAPVIEIGEVARASGHGPPSVRVVYAVRAAERASATVHKLSGTLELRERAGSTPLAARPIEHAVTIAKASPTLASIELDRRTFLYHQALATEAYGALPALRSELRLDRVDGPPSKRVAEKDAATLDRFLRHRLRADVASERLRTAVDALDQKLAEAAALAIGSLSKRLPAPTARPSVAEGENLGKALAGAEAALDDLRFDEAEVELGRLRLSGRLTRPELARCLDLIGAVHALRSKREAAIGSIGRARCVEPKVHATFRRAALSAIYEAAAEAEQANKERCPRPLAIEALTATYLPAEGGKNMVLVRAVFSPDPYQVVEGGDVEFWGAGGQVLQVERSSVKRDGVGSFEVRVEDGADLYNYSGELLLKAFIRDVSGVPVASRGEPDPLPISVEHAEVRSSLHIPWWVWVIAGGVAVAGAATAGVLLTSGDEVDHGIGPFTAQF